MQAVLCEAPPDPSMYRSLPPGAWWETANAQAASEAAGAQLDRIVRTQQQDKANNDRAKNSGTDATAEAPTARDVSGNGASTSGSGDGPRYEAASQRTALSHSQAEVVSGRAIAAARRGNLELRDVWFSYPMRASAPVLRNLSLILPKVGCCFPG